MAALSEAFSPIKLTVYFNLSQGPDLQPRPQPECLVFQLGLQTYIFTIYIYS